MLKNSLKTGRSKIQIPIIAQLGVIEKMSFNGERSLVGNVRVCLKYPLVVRE